eukprot:scaffold101256_cov72-Phaeocystis_antarctica.AAC.3
MHRAVNVACRQPGLKRLTPFRTDHHGVVEVRTQHLLDIDAARLPLMTRPGSRKCLYVVVAVSTHGLVSFVSERRTCKCICRACARVHVQQMCSVSAQCTCRMRAVCTARGSAPSGLSLCRPIEKSCMISRAKFSSGYEPSYDIAVFPENER